MRKQVSTLAVLASLVICGNGCTPGDCVANEGCFVARYGAAGQGGAMNGPVNRGETEGSPCSRPGDNGCPTGEAGLAASYSLQCVAGLCLAVVKECEGREGGAQVCFGSTRRATCAGGPAGAAIFVPCPAGSACHDGVCSCVGDAVVICNEELKLGFKCHNGELVEVECGTP